MKELIISESGFRRFIAYKTATILTDPFKASVKSISLKSGSNPSHPTNSSKAVRFNPVTAFFVGKHFLFVYFIPKAEL